MLTRGDVRGRNSHVVVISINQCVLRISVDISFGKFVLMSDVLLMCPSVRLVRPLID